MKCKLKFLMLKMEKKIVKRISAALNFERLARLLSLYHVNIKSVVLEKVWDFVNLKERTPTETIDKLSLLEGFQSWKDFK